MTWNERIGEGYRMTMDYPLPELRLTLPKGHTFNVSSPRGLHWFVHPHDERYRLAAAVHDYVLHKLHWSRPRAAGYWDDVLRNADVPVWKRKILWVALGLRKFK